MHATRFGFVRGLRSRVLYSAMMLTLLLTFIGAEAKPVAAHSAGSPVPSYITCSRTIVKNVNAEYYLDYLQGGIPIHEEVMLQGTYDSQNPNYYCGNVRAAYYVECAWSLGDCTVNLVTEIYNVGYSKSWSGTLNGFESQSVTLYGGWWGTSTPTNFKAAGIWDTVKDERFS